MAGCGPGVVLALLAAGTCCAAPIPTFEQLDKELCKYKRRADLVGETNANLQMDGLAFYCLFDLVLTVLHDPNHPKYAETRKAWDRNCEKFGEQAGFVARFMGHNLFPLLISTSADYAEGFKEGAARYAPRFEPGDYVQPLPVTIEADGEQDSVAWWHGAADADGDGVSNATELRAVAPEWQVDASPDCKEGCVHGITEAERDRFVCEALGCPSWRVATPPGDLCVKAARE